MSTDVNQASFWAQIYADGGDRWERGEPAPPLARWVTGPDAPPPGRALVPGCGRGHEALMLAAAGWQVTGLDLVAAPLADARAAAAGRGLEERVRFEQGDFFARSTELAGSFDLMLEHTCYCAIDPKRRDDYADAAVRVLAPGGRLAGLFWACGNDSGPPWACSQEELEARFGPRLEIERLEPAVGSFDNRAGELFMIARRR